MKRLALLMVLALLLAGCGKKDPAPAPTEAVPSPAPTSDAPVSPAPTDGGDEDAWATHIDLTALPQKGDLPVELADGTRVAFLNQLENADIALYAVQRPERDLPDLLLRYVDKLQAGGPLAAGTQAAGSAWADLDGDGAQELAVILRANDTTTLTVYEWDGSWTPCPYDSADYSAALLDVIDYTYAARTATVTHGRDSASLTLGHNETGPIRIHEDFGDMAFFRLEEDRLLAVFGVGADVNGEPRYFGTLSASVTYDGAGFSLSQVRLLSNSGV